MKHRIVFKDVPDEGRLSDIVERQVGHVGKQIAVGIEGEVFLRGIVERDRERKVFKVSLGLELPDRAIMARDERESAEDALAEGFRELERRVRKHRAFLRRSGAAESQRRAGGGALSPQRERFLFRELVRADLETLYNFVRRETGFRIASGDLAPGDLNVEEMVEAVVDRARMEFAGRPPELSASLWMLRIAMDHVSAAASRAAAAPALREVGPGEAAEGGRDDGMEEFLGDGREPRLEEESTSGSLPGSSEILGSLPLRRCVNRTLARLPRAWREAFVLHYVEGLSVPEITAVARRPETEVDKYLEYARECLRQRIVESGLSETEAA